MTELIARFKPGENVPVFAQADVLAGRFLKIVGAKTAQGDYPATHCGAGERAFGVSEYDSAPSSYPAHATDRRVNACRPGAIARMEAGAAVAVLADVMSDSVGRPVTFAASAAGQASLLTGVVGSNNAIRWRARQGGALGNAITITIVDPPGNNVALSVDVDGNDIVVTAATDGSSVITSTATLVMAAILEHDTASQLVTATSEGASSGAGVVAAVAQTPLAGGAGTGGARANGQALVAAAAAGDIIEVALY